jgi:hypothetical protein
MATVMMNQIRRIVLLAVVYSALVASARADISIPGMPTGPNIHTLDVADDASFAVGYIASALGDRAFLWQSSLGMLDLTAFLVTCGVDCAADWTLLRAIDISESGDAITGSGIDPSGASATWTAIRPNGDINGDWQVDIFDINLISKHWNQAGPIGDANGDGKVDIFDVNVVSKNWSAPIAFTSEIPPPVNDTAEAPEASTVLIWSGLWGAFAMCWRRLRQ